MLVCLFLLTLGAGGCVERKLMVDSEPQGALVTLNGREVGRTPMTTDFTFYGKYDVVLRKEGYETLKTTGKVNAPIYQIPPIDLFAELIPLNFKDRQKLTYTLTPAPEGPVDSQAIIERAESMQGMLGSSKFVPATQPAK
jgi:hypothetical protein